MIDIHCHILNNVDDGASNITESLNSLKLAEEAGFTDIILTPHYIVDYFDNDKNTIQPIIENLKEEVYQNNIIVKLHHGNEIYIHENLMDLLHNNTASTLANSKYVLFELPLRQKLFMANNVIDQMLEAGYTPILAHPERYTYIQNDPNELIKLIKKGVLIQSNYGSLLEQYGKEAYKTVLKLLKHNMVHFLASDTHRKGYVYENFGKIKRILSKNLTPEHIKDLTTNNAKYILNDWQFTPEPPIFIKEKKSLFKLR